METDKPLSETLERLTADPGLTVMIPLIAIDTMVSLSAGEEPGTYRVLVCKGGEVTRNQTLTPLQLAAVLPRMIRRNEQLLRTHGMILANEAEEFLKSLA
jgi:hypothetical protein